MAAARCSDCTPSSSSTTTDGPEKEKTCDTTEEEEAKRYDDDKCRLFNAYKVDKPSIIQKQTDELSTMIQNSLTEREMIEMTGGPRPMKVKANNNNTTLSSSSLEFSVFHHPLRWDKMTNTSRRTVHHHPLQLVHSSLIYGFYGGDWKCDIHGAHNLRPAYMFHCHQCLFDVCIPCISKPCLNCPASTCNHTQITIDLV